MGMESYYFSLNMNTVLSPVNIIDLFRRHYKVRAYDTIRKRKNSVEHGRISLDNRVVIGMEKNAQNISFTFEVCFSNYWNNLIYIFEIINLLMQFGAIELILPGKSFPMSSLSFSEFCSELNRSHTEKYTLFVKKYGSDMTKNYLPINFYKRHYIK